MLFAFEPFFEPLFDNLDPSDECDKIEPDFEPDLDAFDFLLIAFAPLLEFKLGSV